MPRLYTTVPGAVIRIDVYGEATNEAPAMVPEDVALEFEGREGYRVERDETVASVPPGLYTKEGFAAAVDEAAAPRLGRRKPAAPADEGKE